MFSHLNSYVQSNMLWVFKGNIRFWVNYIPGSVAPRQSTWRTSLFMWPVRTVSLTPNPTSPYLWNPFAKIPQLKATLQDPRCKARKANQHLKKQRKAENVQLHCLLKTARTLPKEVAGPAGALLSVARVVLFGRRPLVKVGPGWKRWGPRGPAKLKPHGNRQTWRAGKPWKTMKNIAKP